MATGCGSIEVIPQFSSELVQTNSCSNLPSEAVVGDTVEVFYSAVNDNPTAAEATIELFQQEGTGTRESIGQTTEQIDGNAGVEGSFVVTLPTSGTFTYSVEVTSATTLTGL